MTRNALVTGANRGIGKAIVAELANKGLRVLLGSRDLVAGEQAANEINGDVVAVELDLSEPDTRTKHIEAIQSEHPQIDVLVNNAGILKQGDVLGVRREDFYLSMQVNMLAAFDLIQALAPGMNERNYGRIVNVSSGWGSFTDDLTGPAAYSVSKAAINALTLSTSHALEANVKINSMCPGWVRTDMGGSAAERSPEQGADTAIWLATLPEDGPTAGFFRDRTPIEW